MVLSSHSRVRFHGFFLFLALSPALSAAPRLSLEQTVLTLTVAPGTDAPAQSVDAVNIGDGSLNLSASSSVPWLIPNIGDPAPCSVKGICIPVQIAVPSTPLAPGRYTGTVTVSDPNAVDSPQFIVVTLLVGGSVPSSLEFFLPPGGSGASNFTTATHVLATVANNSPWLSIAVNGIGSFSFNVPYQVAVNVDPAMATGDYNDTINISGSIFAPDNKAISVLLHVTTLPVLQVSPTAFNVNIAQGANPQSSTAGGLSFINAANTGQGTLSIDAVSAGTADGANWLSAALVNGSSTQVSVTVDPTGLAVGAYQGTITITSNGAANPNVNVPVQFTVETPSPPVAFAGSVVNNATFATGESVALGELVVVSGDQFTYGDPQQATPPLDIQLAGTQVLVDGQPAPVLSLTPTQITFQIPYEASLGDGLVQVVNNGQSGNLVYINVAPVAPHLVPLNGGPYATITGADGNPGGIPNSPVAVGDNVVISAVGLGLTSPAVADGAPGPADSSAQVSGVQVCFGPHSITQALCTPAASANLAPGAVGVYQINVQIPPDVPSGSVPFFITVGEAASEMEQIAVQ
ncbi:MAG TPA: IPT/TIG domain-containing protein [Bryobacteraceae bacterium]|nr:IPT/TIG domain-containing protein [Bryobacteraceae bacterium]